jgi:hypothetical protein
MSQFIDAFKVLGRFECVAQPSIATPVSQSAAKALRLLRAALVLKIGPTSNGKDVLATRDGRLLKHGFK